MEQVRVILAIVLSFLVIFVWSLFFTEKPPVQRPIEPDDQTTMEEKERSSEIPVKGTASYAPKYDLVEQNELDNTAPRTVKVSNGLFTALLTERGAALKSLTLNHYRKSIEPESPPFEMVSETLLNGTVLLSFEKGKIPSDADLRYRLERAGDNEHSSINVIDSPQDVGFTWRDGNGIEVTKVYRFHPNSYLIDIAINLKNGTHETINEQLALSLYMEKGENNGSSYAFEGPSTYIDNSLNQIKIDKIEETETHSGEIKWIAMQERYFLTSLVPLTNPTGTVRVYQPKNEIVRSSYIEDEISIERGTREEYLYKLFIGPKSLQTLENYQLMLEKAVDFGWFDFIAKPCVWILNFIYKYIPNYGIAIIILTILTKILLWPLGNKSYKSMNEMKRLQPEMTRIREKFKDDRKKMNEEMMRLYKTYKINPLGGCLPMVVQLPVFIGLYRMLYEAIELRHAPFFGWIKDLSAPDRLFDFGFSIPFMQEPYGIPVLTIIMGASMLVQQKMSPAPGDPTQAKMMMLMPIIFTVIFINFPAGLVLYWLVNNLISMAQQFYIQKKHA